MKKAGISAIFILLLAACNSRGPDVSGIRVKLTVDRFDQDFFALDTISISQGLDRLNQKYPAFLPDYLYNILGLPPHSDTSQADLDLLRQFIRDYRPVKDSADLVFGNLDRTIGEIHDGLQHVRYYFPNYHIPDRVITFIGPMDAFFNAALGGYGDVLTQEGLGVGLQLHLGKDFSMYHSEMGQSLYPDYISRKFTPAYIPVNCIKNIIDDIYPNHTRGKSLLDIMVEKGKRMYVLDHLMPDVPDTIKTGYTGSQLNGCYENEGRIWNYFLANNLLNTTEPDLMKGYVSDAPSTPEFGQDSPGFIGLFCGWQIVKKYMDKNPSVKLPDLLKTDPRKIYEVSKYRPR